MADVYISYSIDYAEEPVHEVRMPMQQYAAA